MRAQVTELTHPLVGHHLCAIREATTGAADFRAALRRLAMLLGVEATAGLATRPVTVQTPLGLASSRKLEQRIGLVPILRAGLALVDPLLQLLPEAQVWHLGLYRNEATAEPVSYYDKLTGAKPPDVGLVLDPMLATGGSIRLAVHRLREWGVPEIRVLSVIASQPGIDRLVDEFPDVPLFVCAIDPELNEQSYIVPGLGDAGDRAFDT